MKSLQCLELILSNKYVHSEVEEYSYTFEGKTRFLKYINFMFKNDLLLNLSKYEIETLMFEKTQSLLSSCFFPELNH